MAKRRRILISLAPVDKLPFMDSSATSKYRQTDADGGVCLWCRMVARMMNGIYYCNGDHHGDDLEIVPTASEIAEARLRHPSNQSAN